MNAETLRPTLANILMILFIIGVSIGFGMWVPFAGVIAFGVACGLVGLLLGSE